MDIQTKLQQGIAAAKAGQKAEARQLLVEVVEADETQLPAWLWLNQLVDGLEDKEVCLENILTLDPNNQAAQKELSHVQARQKMLLGSVYVEDEAETDDTAAAVSTATVAGDEFDNEWLCPYCTALTKPAHKSCPKCHRRLLVSKPVSDRSSTWLWRGIFLQLAIIIFLALFAVGLFVVATRGRGILNPWPFLPAYLGLPVNRPAEQIQAVLRAFSRGTFWNFMGAIAYSAGLLAVLYWRVRFGNFLYFFNAAAILTVAFLGAYFYPNYLIILLFSAIGLLFGLAQLAVALSTWNEFNYKATRLRLRADRGFRHHGSFYLSGRDYSKRDMWGAAIIHFRRAVAGEPGNLAYRLALIVAYLRVARYDLAKKELAEAKKLAPHSNDVQRLEQKLAAAGKA